MLTTGNQLKAARALAEIEQTALADRADVNVNTIRNMEASGAADIAGRAANVQAVQRALEAVGIEFLNHGQPGVRLAKVSAEGQGNTDTGGRDAEARDMATHQVNKALRGVAASPGEKAARRDRLTKPPQRPVEPIDEGKRPEGLDASNDD